MKLRPKFLFIQNPSIVLAGLSCIMKNVFNYKLIIDRHSNFRLEEKDNKKIKWLLFHFLSKYSVRNADLTIVTNTFLAELVNSWHGNSFVLQDKLPDLNIGLLKQLKGEKNIVFISTFSGDEPIREVMQAANLIDKKWVIYITGSYKKWHEKQLILEGLPENVVLTDFLPEKDYQTLLISVDLIVVLTKQDNILTCGAYEGVSLLKPTIVSDTLALKNYFKKGVIYTKNDPESIASSIQLGIKNKNFFEKQIRELKEQLKFDWENNFQKISEIINHTL